MRLATLILLLSACSSSAPGEPPADAAAPAPTLTVVTADRTDLLFRYRGADGEGTAQAIADVPEASRGRVQVVDLSQSPAQRRASGFVQVFDLRSAGADGRFRGELVPRAELDAKLAAVAEAARPKAAKVTMYSASWCGVCNKARAFLTDKGVPFVEKDVDQDAAAAKRLADAGQGGSVPVFEVGGRWMKGFDAKRLMAMIRGTGT